MFSFSTNLFLERKALPKELQSFLAQVLSRRKKVFCKKKKCYNSIFSDEEFKERIRRVIGHPTLEDRDVRKEFQRRYGDSKYIWIDRRADILDDIVCFTEEGMRKGKSPILLD